MSELGSWTDEAAVWSGLHWRKPLPQVVEYCGQPNHAWQCKRRILGPPESWADAGEDIQFAWCNVAVEATQLDLPIRTVEELGAWSVEGERVADWVGYHGGRKLVFRRRFNGKYAEGVIRIDGDETESARKLVWFMQEMLGRGASDR